MAHEWEGEFDDRHRYGRPQHERPEGTRDAELYGRPQHRAGEDGGTTRRVGVPDVAAAGGDRVN